MFTGIRPSFGLAIALLCGCAPVQKQSNPNIASDADAANASALQSSVEYVPGELNEESLLDLLTAELAGQQRDFDTAFELYFRQAQLNRSTELAERATRIAQFNRNPEAVLTAARLWQEIAPEAAEPPQILINILLHEARFAEAFELLRAEPSFGAEILLVIESLLDTFDQESAAELAELLQQRLDASPEQLDLLLVLARVQILRQEETTALNLLNRGLAIEPEQPDLIVEKAQLLRSVYSDAEQALELVESALASNRDHRQLRAVHVQLLLELQPDSVEAAVERAIDQAERDPQLVYYYALLLLENEQPQQSLVLLDELISRDPARTDLNLYIGVNHETLGNREAAIQAFAKVESGDLLFNAVSRALGLLETGTEYERAQALVESARASDEERASQLAVIFARWAGDNGELERGLDYLNKQIEADPNDVSLLYTRALMVEPLDHQQMLDDLERAYALNPDNAGTQNALGYSLLEHSQEYRRAYELIERALAESPDDPAYLDSMGWALHKLERNSEALPYLERAFEQMPDPEVTSHLIIVLTQLGEIERAKALLTEQEELYPGNEDLAEARRWLER